jgi:hypothetical protein
LTVWPVLPQDKLTRLWAARHDRHHGLPWRQKARMAGTGQFGPISCMNAQDGIYTGCMASKGYIRCPEYQSRLSAPTARGH